MKNKVVKGLMKDTHNLIITISLALIEEVLDRGDIEELLEKFESSIDKDILFTYLFSFQPLPDDLVESLLKEVSEDKGENLRSMLRANFRKNRDSILENLREMGVDVREDRIYYRVIGMYNLGHTTHFRANISDGDIFVTKVSEIVTVVIIDKECGVFNLRLRSEHARVRAWRKI